MIHNASAATNKTLTDNIHSDCKKYDRDAYAAFQEVAIAARFSQRRTSSQNDFAIGTHAFLLSFRRKCRIATGSLPSKPDSTHVYITFHQNKNARNKICCTQKKT
jgi:hypothetical protein